MPPRPRAPPQRLTKQQLTYFSLGLPIGLIAVSVSIVGLFVVMGAACGRVHRRGGTAAAAAHSTTRAAAAAAGRHGAHERAVADGVCRPVAARRAAQPLHPGVHAQLWGDRCVVRRCMRHSACAASVVQPPHHALGRAVQRTAWLGSHSCCGRVQGLATASCGCWITAGRCRCDAKGGSVAVRRARRVPGASPASACLRMLTCLCGCAAVFAGGAAAAAARAVATAAAAAAAGEPQGSVAAAWLLPAQQQRLLWWQQSQSIGAWPEQALAVCTRRCAQLQQRSREPVFLKLACYVAAQRVALNVA